MQTDNKKMTTLHSRQHWKYIYKKRRARNIISSKQIIIGQLIALCGSLLAGFILELNKSTIGLYAGAFLLLPGIVDLSASITGAMCAKINHLYKFKNNTFNLIKQSVLFAILLAITCSLIVGLTGGIIGSLFLDIPFYNVMILAVSSMLTVGLVAYPAMLLLTIVIKKTSFNPDNLIGPIETGFTDTLTALAFALIVRFLV